MRLIILICLTLGIGLAGGAVYMAQAQIGRYQTERDRLLAAQASAPPMTTVVVVKRALKYGEHFIPEDLETIRIQSNKLPRGTFRAVSAKAGTDAAKTAVFAEGEIRPRSARRSYAANEILLSERITDPGADVGIMANLSPNMRAFTIQVDRVSGVSGFLRPGDFVDVYWLGTIADQPVTRLINPNLRLIAVDQSADSDRAAETQIARTVTAEVTPEQVAELALAQATGKLTLSLVGQNDTDAVGTVEVDRNRMLGITPAVAQSNTTTCTIRTRKGTEIQTIEIPCPN